jgi:hypothetical protein
MDLGIMNFDVPQSNDLAPCGDPACAGCYQVEGGAWIHPPRPYFYGAEEFDAIRKRICSKSRKAKKKEKWI